MVMINTPYAQLLKEGKVYGSRGLSANSVRRVHATLHRSPRDALRWDRLSRNPCNAADPPRLGGPRRRLKPGPTWNCGSLEGGEGRPALPSVADASHDRPAWGGPALALRWADVDLERAQLSVRRSLVSISGSVEVHMPKTSRGRRLVALDPFTVSVLRDWSLSRSRHLKVLLLP